MYQACNYPNITLEKIRACLWLEMAICKRVFVYSQTRKKKKKKSLLTKAIMQHTGIYLFICLFVCLFVLGGIFYESSA